MSQDNFKKFSSDIIVSSSGTVLPVKFEYFHANRQDNKSVSLQWQVGQIDNVQAFKILRSGNGRDFVSIATVTAVHG